MAYINGHEVNDSLFVAAQAIADGSVTTPKLADGAVTADKIANNAVTNSKIQDGEITAAKLTSEYQQYIANKADIADIPTSLADLTEDSTHMTVTDTEKADWNAKLSVVNTNDILQNAVTTEKIADQAITTAKIDAGAITTAKIGDYQVTYDKIKPGDIRSASIADNAVRYDHLDTELQESIDKADTAMQPEDDVFLQNATSVEDITTVTEQFGDLSTVDIRTPRDTLKYWFTNYPPMQAVYGKQLYSIKMNCETAGEIKLLGYDGEINSSNFATAHTDAQTADTSGYEIATITLEVGEKTYLFDGSDSRVTIINQTAINSCPKTIGIQKTLASYGMIMFNYTPVPSFANYYCCLTSSMSSQEKGRTFAIDVSYVSNSATFLELTMNNGVEHRVNLTEIMPTKTSDLVNDSGYITAEEIAQYPLQGKKVSIIGDSLSALTGYIPAGYGSYYPRGDVQTNLDMWWGKLANETRLTILKNCSWAGSYVTNDPSNPDTTAKCASTDARINDLADGSTKPDIIICFIGLNDFNTTYHRFLGTYDGTTAIPSEATISTFGEAYALMLNKVMTTYPNAKVYCCTWIEVNNSLFNPTSQFPTVPADFPCININNETLAAFNERIRTLAKNLGAELIETHSCGITPWNMAIYSRDGAHPKKAGQGLLSDTIKAALLEDYR